MNHIIIFLLLHLFSYSKQSRVIELDQNFNNFVDYGPWLVKFYAPWCGYCKKLEPIYENLALKLSNEPIKVARLDATRFPEVASLYHIRGYPTIKYINGTNIYSHEGDRTVDHLIRFVKRSMGPALKTIQSSSEFTEILRKHTEEPFYLYIGNPNSYLGQIFQDIATEKRLLSYFYTIDALPKDISSNEEYLPSLGQDIENGTIVVWKRSLQKTFHFESSSELDTLNSTLFDWIVVNRFPLFPKVSQIDIMELGILNKPIAIFLMNKSESDLIQSGYTDSDIDNYPSIRYHSIGEKLAISKDSPISDLIYVWTDDSSVIGDWALSYILSPNIAVFTVENDTIFLHPSYQHMHVMQQLDQNAITRFIRDFNRGRVQGYGGKGFFPKMRKALYEFMMGLIEFVTTAPLLAMFVIGIPLSVVSFLFYAICCMESNNEQYRKTVRTQRKERQHLYQVPLKSSEELNIDVRGDKKND